MAGRACRYKYGLHLHFKSPTITRPTAIHNQVSPQIHRFARNSNLAITATTSNMRQFHANSSPLANAQQGLPTEQSVDSTYDTSSTSRVPMRTYDMFYTPTKKHVKLHLGNQNEPCVYFLETTLFGNNPVLQLRSGDSKNDPVVAFFRVSGTIREPQLLIGSGDCEHIPESELTREDLRRDRVSFLRNNYQFATSVGSKERKTYNWKRDEEQWGKNVYHCTDDNDQLVATLLCGALLNWNKCGEVKMIEGLAKELEEFLMMGALGIWASEALGSFFSGYTDKQDTADDTSGHVPPNGEKH